MPFLVLDGVTIPVVVDSPQISIENIGDEKRAISGNLLLTRRDQKRKWDVRTTPMSVADAEALAGWVGRCIRPNLTASPYATTSGYLPVIATGINQDAASSPTGEAAQYLNYSPTSGEISLVSATASPFYHYDDAWSLGIWIKGGVTASHNGHVFHVGSKYLYVPETGVVTWSSPAMTGCDLDDGFWHHIVIAAYRDSSNVEHYSMYCDGALAASATATSGWVSLEDTTIIQIASYDVLGNSNTYTYPGYIYQPIFVSAAMIADQVLPLYNGRNGIVLGDWPLRRITGSMVQNRLVICRASLDSFDPIDYVSGGSVVAGCAVGFILTEV
jgi:hypothetical protein